jgi:hypothetical protein
MKKSLPARLQASYQHVGTFTDGVGGASPDDMGPDESPRANAVDSFTGGFEPSPTMAPSHSDSSQFVSISGGWS